MSTTNQSAQDYASDGNATASAFRSLIGQYVFIDIVKVVEVNGELLTVKSMVLGLTTEMKKIDNQLIYNVPFIRLQRGNSAVVMDPVVGDIGLMAVCDRDITNVKSSKNESVPPTLRRHSKADAVYITGIASLNDEPAQYAKFSDAGIEVVSPTKVAISSPDIELNGSSSVAVNSPNIILNGAVSQGSGSYGGAAHFKNAVTSDTEVSVGAIKLTYHGHAGVQTGSGTSGGTVAI